MSVSYLLLIQLLAIIINLSIPTAINPNERVDCAPRPNDSKQDCLNRGCIWDDNYEKYHPTVPLCYFPANTGYTMRERLDDGRIRLQKASFGGMNPYDKDLPELDFTYRQMGSALFVRIGNENRYVPPVPLNNYESIGPASERLTLSTMNASSIFAFNVHRESDGMTLWDTSIGGLLFGDQYIQIAAYLPSDKIYGFGENSHQRLKHDFSKYTTWGMYGRDQPPDGYTPNSENLYGVHPFYLGLEDSGKAHGVLIFNSNVQEVTTGPAPHLVYRTIGGMLDLYFFPGPSPEEVIQQYQQLIGRPYLPAYWTLGYQFCRYGYKDLNDLKATIRRIRDSEIPIDVAYADIDYMERFKDFTYDLNKWGDFPNYANQLHADKMKLILIVDPAIEVDYDVFKRGIDKKASFIEWERKEQVPQDIQSLYPLVKDTKIMLGIVWPDKHVAFPDFLDPTDVTTNWWTEEIVTFRKKLPFDGVWIDMNEPSNSRTNEIEERGNNYTNHQNLTPLKCPTSEPDARFDIPPYQTIDAYQWGAKSVLAERTLCLLGRSVRDSNNMYNTHNLYGWSETVATHKALGKATGKRGAVISRSTFPSSGHYGSHWLGDNTSRWPDLLGSIIGVQEFNLFGIPHVGADVCGFNEATNEELCLRWQQLGAFHSFFRNHNSIDNPPQDPSQWKSVAIASRAANLYRYQHLPYLYSLHFRASLSGGTVVRPVFFEFPNDFLTHELSFQFMWGSSMMVIPVLSPNVNTVRGYLPYGSSWYSISNAHKYGLLIPSGYSTFNAPKNTPLPTFIRAGSIIPRQKPGMTTAESRLNEFQLIIALTPETLTAKGELFWDDGDSLIESIDTYNYFHFEHSMVVDRKRRQTTLNINCTRSPSEEGVLTLPTLDTIEVLGYPFSPKFTSFQLNGLHLKIDTSRSAYSALKKFLILDTPSMIDLNKGGPIWTITWQN